MSRRAWIVAAAGLLVGCQEPVPPLAEALVVVDTNAAVPRAVNRLRVDLYDGRGAWFDSRDVARPGASEWPVSFSVYSEDEERDTTVWIRLRAYPEGRVRDYLGERYQPPSGPVVDVEGDGEPRLRRDGQDITPAVEPHPLTAIDRLVRVRLEPGVRGRLVVLLDRVCAGTMPIFGDARPDEGAQTCIDTPEELEPVPTREVEREVMIVPPSELADEPPGCGGAMGEDRVCMSGGATLLGSSELGLFPDLEPRPERLVVHSPFWVDRYEVTVGRFRDALARGFVPTVMPAVNEGPITGTIDGSCTWSSVDAGREGFALSCASWQTAREFCLFEGGDLPTEAQFEHMATLASELGRSRYPWGDEPPSCERAVYGRVDLAGFPGVCQHLGTGPLPIDPEERMDVTREGVVGLAGGIGEWMRDDYREYGEACWSEVVDPECVDETAALKASRGASWAAPPTILPSAVRLGADPLGRRSFQGFRCVYAEAP